jgi:MerR family mercuric resistance operon transcriptional regulator
MFTIGKLADAGGVGVETVRFYQRKGLIKVPSSSDGFRQYSNDDLRSLLALDRLRRQALLLKRLKSLFRWILRRRGIGLTSWQFHA